MRTEIVSRPISGAITRCEPSVGKCCASGSTNYVMIWRSALDELRPKSAPSASDEQAKVMRSHSGRPVLGGLLALAVLGLIAIAWLTLTLMEGTITKGVQQQELRILADRLESSK